jgi:hypothetical protein
MDRTLKLGELTLKCSKFPNKLPVVYDNGKHPTMIDSWRGYYAELALNHSDEGEPMSCGDFVGMLDDADGKVYRGYKGGAFEMNEKTDVWVDNWGEYTEVIITDANVENGKVVLSTEQGQY